MNNVLMWGSVMIGVLAFIYAAIIYLHNRSMRKHRDRMEADYRCELEWQTAREEELARERHTSRLEETNRDYMDAIRALEIMEELEGDKKDELR